MTPGNALSNSGIILLWRSKTVYTDVSQLLPAGLQSPKMAIIWLGLYIRKCVLKYTHLISVRMTRTQFLPPPSTTCSRSGMMQFGKICLSTQKHAPQKVLAYAYAMHGLPGQPVCTPRPSSGRVLSYIRFAVQPQRVYLRFYLVQSDLPQR